jgi:predicted Zn-dependent protease
MVLRGGGGRLVILPDGTVVTDDALLRRVPSEAGLAGLIAHVRAHDALGHTEARLAENVAALDDALMGRDAARAEAALALVYDAPFSHDQEQAADALALESLQQSGWSASGLGETLEALAGSAFVATHPFPKARQQVLVTAPSVGRNDVSAWQAVQRTLGIVVDEPVPPMPVPLSRGD